MTSRLRSIPPMAATLIALPTAVLAASALQDLAVAAVVPYLAAGLVGVVGSVVGWLAATSERFAAPARAKSPEERSLAEKAVIEADRRIDAINIKVIETFATRWINAHLDEVLSSDIFEPMRQAELMVDNAFEGLKRRNPQIAAATGIDKLSLQEILAAAIGQVQGDRLAASLRAAGAPAVDAV